MRRALITFAGAALVAVAIAAAPAFAAPKELGLTPVGRLPFPERGFVVDLSEQAAVDAASVKVRENGRRIRDVDVAPVAAAGIHFGVVLAVDASNSMAGRPLQGAVEAARKFLSKRDPDQEVGIVAFNGRVNVVQAPTDEAAQLEQSLAASPALASGTRIYDAVDESLRLLARARLSSGSIVLLSDGADVGSKTNIDAVLAKARARHVRIFAIGLRSGNFDSTSPRRLATATGGSYAEASSAEELASIYDGLARRLSGEYLITYRSGAAPHSGVNVAITFKGIGAASTHYVAPTPSGLAPFHRSPLSRFLGSPAAPLLVSLLVGALIALMAVAFLRPRRSTLVERVASFAGGERRTAEPLAARVSAIRSRARRGLLGKLERDLEIARIEMSVKRVVLLTTAGTALATLVLSLIAPVFALVGLLGPLVTRTLIARKLRKVRDEFAEQLAPNLQVLASALRVGHSFIGALKVVVENAHEPSRSELRRAVTDEQLGVPVDEALQRVADRMASRDLEQVALLAELQRTAGGNAAEVLDTVVETLRERADIRRLIKTLTAQGRMARWILTALPVVAGLALFLLQRDSIRPMFETGGGQIALVVATGMVVAGSLVIQKIVDIKV